MTLYNVFFIFFFYRTIANDNTEITTWTTGTSKSWFQLKNGFKNLALEFSTIADKGAQEVFFVFYISKKLF